MNCRNCGAPLMRTGDCSYCGTLATRLQQYEFSDIFYSPTTVPTVEKILEKPLSRNYRDSKKIFWLFITGGVVIIVVVGLILWYRSRKKRTLQAA